MVGGLVLAVLCSTTVLVAADGLPTSYGVPAPVYGPPAGYSPAPAPAPAPLPIFRRIPGSQPIPVVPFPNFGRNVVHHVINKVVNHVAESVGEVARAVEAAGDFARSVVHAKKALFAPLRSAEVAAPASQYAAPAVQYAAPAVQYAAPAAQYAAPAVQFAAPPTEYGAPTF